MKPLLAALAVALALVAGTARADTFTVVPTRIAGERRAAE